jgi:uncharacterized protein with HEPN domain
MSDLSRERLERVLESIELIEERMKTIHSDTDFTSTPTGVILMDAIALRLQTIGENIKAIERTEPEVLQRHTTIAWKRIIRFRDKISHHYDEINHVILFDICVQHLPPLKAAILTILDASQ